MIAEKRQRLESQLWAITEADIGDFFETVEVANSKAAIDETGKLPTVRKQRPKMIADLAPEHRKLIEDATVDRSGNFVPRLYSRTQANAALCKLLNIGAQTERESSDVTRLSDAELLQQLADQAKELGVNINLSYDFAQPPATEPTAAADTPVVDVTAGVTTADAADVAATADAADVFAAAELKIAAQPEFAGARPVRARPKHR